jgi:hypothetical protein
MPDGGRPAEPRRAGADAPAFLPNDLDPTVFDEAFLRQLERLLILCARRFAAG